MDSAEPTQDELDAELKDLRSGLRAYGKKVALHIQQMDMPETPLEAERIARMVRATDQMLIQVYAPPAPPPRPRDMRSGPSSRARRDPDEDDEDDEDEDENSPEHRMALAQKLINLVHGLTRVHAQATGFWPDGQAYDPHRLDWKEAAGSDMDFNEDSPLDADGDPSVDAFQAVLLRRFNNQTRFQAEKRGLWPDDTPFSAADPGFWSITANQQVNRKGPATGETPGPGYLPKWVVHRPP